MATGTGTGNDTASGAHAGAGGVWDLADVVLVLPGARAGRRLAERLAERAALTEVSFFPPEVTTVGQLPEFLYPRRRPFASTLVQQLAWAHALRGASRETLLGFLTDPPAGHDDPQWLELGTLLWRQHRELAADGLDFREVAEQGRQVSGFLETARWEALADVQQAYLAQLDRLGLWDRQTARRVALQHGECHSDRELVVIAAVDMSRALRQMLAQVQSRVTVLTFAEESWAEYFDPDGCVVPARWQSQEIRIRDSDLVAVEGPLEQARACVQEISRLDGRYAADEIAIGVPDESLVSLIQRELAGSGVPARFGPGRSIECTRPLRFLRGLVDYLESRTFRDLGDLLRHPDVSETLRRQHPDWDRQVARFDMFCREHLPQSTDQFLAEWDKRCEARADGPTAAGGLDPSPRPEVDALMASVAQLLRNLEAWWADLRGPARIPSAWAEPVLAVIARLYGDRECDLDDPPQRRLLEGCEAIRDGLLALRQLPAELSTPLTAPHAILLALTTLSQRNVPAPPSRDGVELLGWLELPLDDSPALLVTNLNEGQVPTSANSDLFLPNALRSRLGLDDNARRYARDAYALTVLSRSRRELRLILGRRDEQGNPLLPSRLLFATNDETRIARCLRLFGEAPMTRDQDRSAADMSETGERVRNERGRPREHRFVVRRPANAPRVETLNVTDFKLYLACPFRFYLTRVLKLKSVLPQPVELDGAAFGNRLHEILEAFGQSPWRDSCDGEAIEQFLLARLHDVFLEVYGPQPRPTVKIQRAQLAERLRVFAQRQARWREMGWQIHVTEGERRATSAAWPVDGEPFGLRGRIDRVDWHPDRQVYAILDYKSSDQGSRPRASHHGGVRKPLRAQDWSDLQLPLYRHLAEEWGLTGPVELGYITLPRQANEAGFHLAAWTPEELQAADEAAREVIRRIRRGEFWPPQETTGGFDPGVDRICQADVFDRHWEPAAPTLRSIPSSGGTRR